MCEKKVPVLNSMIKNRNTRFLKSYTLNYTNTEGNEKLYEMVSNFDYEKPEEIGHLSGSGRCGIYYSVIGSD